MQVSAQDFGQSGVVRHQCDRCHKPLGIQPDGTAALAWKGRYGTYCSNKCLKIQEKNMPETTETTPTNNAPVPPIITRSSPKPTAPTKAPTKKAHKNKCPMAVLEKM